MSKSVLQVGGCDKYTWINGLKSCQSFVSACDTNGKHQFKAMKYILLNMHCELGCLACKNAAPDLVEAGVAQGTFSDSAGVTVCSQMKTSLIIAVPMAHWQLAAGSHSFPQAPNHFEVAPFWPSLSL